MRSLCHKDHQMNEILEMNLHHRCNSSMDLIDDIFRVVDKLL